MIIPQILTGGSDRVAEFHVLASGVAELVCGGMLLIPQIRRLD